MKTTPQKTSLTCDASLSVSFSRECDVGVLDVKKNQNNFQQGMSRLAYRGRAQQSVISIVNCKIPRITRILNVHCAFGVSLKACLLQCLIFSYSSVRCDCCEYLRVKAPEGSWRAQSIESLCDDNWLSFILFSLSVFGELLLLPRWWSTEDMKLGQRTRWI